MSPFYNPVRIFTGRDSSQQFAEAVEKDFSQADPILVLTRGNGVHRHSRLQPIMARVENKTVRLLELDISNPDIADIVKIKAEVESFDYRMILAIGGGSVMDTAKALSAMKTIPASDENTIRRAMEDKLYTATNEMVPWVGIPTTSGTGSEVTCWATIWDKAFGKKYSITDERLYAKAAVIIPELTSSVPLKTSVFTALDALCHATEAYWSLHTNPVTRVYALEAIKKITVFLPKLKDNPEAAAVREQLAMASLYAGLAFSNTRTTACHSISYPLTLLHGMEHGLAASYTLGAVLKRNAPGIAELDRLLEAFGVQHVEEVEPFIFDLYRQYHVPTPLREYGVSFQNVQHIVQRAYTKGRMDNNPTEITAEALTEILTEMI